MNEEKEIREKVSMALCDHGNTYLSVQVFKKNKNAWMSQFTFSIYT